MANPKADPLDALIRNQLPSTFMTSSRVPLSTVETSDKHWEDIAVGYCRQRSWRTLATFSKQRLLITEVGDVDTLTKLWCYRLIALIHIGLCQLAAAELDKLGDLFRPDLRYEAYLELFPGRSGSMIPFTLQVIWAQLPAYLGELAVSLDRLYFLMGWCHQASAADPGREQFWDGRIQQLSLLVVNHLISLEDYALANEVLGRVLESSELDPTLLQISVRFNLHSGNLPGAKQAFNQLLTSLDATTRPHFERSLKIDASLLHMAEGNWRMAQQVLEELVQADPKDSVAANNLAVGSLYLGELPKAIEALQKLTALAQDPKSFKLRPEAPLKVIIHNLTTLYELATHRHLNRKRTLLEQLHPHLGDGFELTAFKLPGLSES